MERHYVRLAIPILVVIILVSVLILGGLASQLPDGFEWTFFVFAGIPEPTAWFEGLWSFLGEGRLAEALAGVIGLMLVISLSYVIFSAMSHRTHASSVTS